jgi:hypothetical protein
MCRLQKHRGEDKAGFIYYCSHCNFSLESKCASLPLTIQVEIHHEHQLTLFWRSVSFTCEVLEEEVVLEVLEELEED